MTTDVRTLLHDTAEAPSRGPDLEGALRSARDRRRRRRGVGALVAVVVVALVGGAFVASSGGGGDGARVAIGPRQSTDTPDGWKRIDAGAGISIAVPPGWDEYDYGHTDVAERRVAVGTTDPAEEIPVACPQDGGATGPTGSWVSVWEYAPDSTSVTSPTGETTGVEDRTASFETIDGGGGGGSCAHGADPFNEGAFNFVAFRDAGRVFVARVVVRVAPADISDDQRARIVELQSQISGVTAQLAAEPPNAAQLQEQLRVLQYQSFAAYGIADDWDLAKQVLDTLTVEPAEGTTPTTSVPTASSTVPPTTTLPLPTTTTLPAFVPSTDDERAIQELFVSWLRDHPDDETRIMVEDADALLESIHEGLAQHTAEDLALYSGTVSGIRMLDADHAEVQYTLLHDGRPQFGLRTGTAVRIDGRWMVSRATECALLSLGGITCPPE